jgi:hypothetical protein
MKWPVFLNLPGGTEENDKMPLMRVLTEKLEKQNGSVYNITKLCEHFDKTKSNR